MVACKLVVVFAELFDFSLILKTFLQPNATAVIANTFLGESPLP
jgi:hypothetical protein